MKLMDAVNSYFDKLDRNIITYNAPQSQRVTPTSTVGWNTAGSDSAGPTPDELYGAYRISSMVYAACTRIATSVRRLEYVAVVRDRAGDYLVEQSPSNKLVYLMENPNDCMDFADIMERHSLQLSTAGESYIHGVGPVDMPVPRGGIPASIWPIDSGKIDPLISSETGRLTGFRDLSRPGVVYSTREMAQIVMPDPQHYYSGIAPAEAAWSQILASTRGYKWLNEILKRKARPSIAWSLPPAAAGTETTDTMQEWLKMMLSMDNPDHMSAGPMTPHMLSYSPTDMGIINIIEDARISISAAFGVPLPLLSDMDNATLANMESSIRWFYTNTVVPQAQRIIAAYNRWFKSNRFNYGAELWFDVDSVPEMVENETAKTERLVMQINSSMITPNEARAELGRDAVVGAGADSLLVDGMKNTLEQVTGEPGATPPRQEDM